MLTSILQFQDQYTRKRLPGYSTPGMSSKTQTCTPVPLCGKTIAGTYYESPELMDAL